MGKKMESNKSRSFDTPLRKAYTNSLQMSPVNKQHSQSRKCRIQVFFRYNNYLSLSIIKIHCIF